MSKASEVIKLYSKLKQSEGDTGFKIGDGIDGRFRTMNGVINAFALSLIHI